MPKLLNLRPDTANSTVHKEQNKQQKRRCQQVRQILTKTNLEKDVAAINVIGSNKQNQNLSKARQLLRTSSVSLVVVRGTYIWQRSGRGIRPLYDLVTEEEHNLKGGALADIVIGKAAALLILYAGLTSAYARVMSRPAYNLLVHNNVDVVPDVIVEGILNRDQTGPCPMESLTTNLNIPGQAYRLIGQKLQKWRNQ